MKNWVVGVIVILLLTILALELILMYTFSWVCFDLPFDGGFLLNSQAYT